jgi:hypothetical protein
MSSSNSQTMPALGAAGANHGPPSTGGHADQKTVGTLAPDDGWLISTFHGKPLKSLRIE